MADNSCFAIVKPPVFKSCIRDLSSNAGSNMVKIGRHYYTHRLIIEGHTGEASVSQMHHDFSAPKEPSKAEVELHSLTHMPYRSRCPICVGSKGRGDYYKGTPKARSITQIMSQMDYAYIRGNMDESDRTYLVKVPTMAESITRIWRTITSLQEKVSEGLNSQVTCRMSTALQMLEQYGVLIHDINTTDQAFIWMVKHCAFLHNRYQIGQDDLPASHPMKASGQKYKPAIVACGETLLMSIQHQEHENKKVPKRPRAQWSFGIWVGRDSPTRRYATLTTEATCVKCLVE
eukprot:5449438-Amphidinium_carterae.1